MHYNEASTPAGGTVAVLYCGFCGLGATLPAQPSKKRLQPDSFPDSQKMTGPIRTLSGERGGDKTNTNDGLIIIYHVLDEMLIHYLGVFTVHTHYGNNTELLN